VDVNVAARVGDAAQGGEILATDAACALLDPDEFEIGAARPLDAAGAPEELTISAVQPRHDKG
jgi:adenylate cyclase